MHVSNLLESGKKIKLQEKLIIFSKKKKSSFRIHWPLLWCLGLIKRVIQEQICYNCILWRKERPIKEDTKSALS